MRKFIYGQGGSASSRHDDSLKFYVIWGSCATWRVFQAMIKSAASTASLGTQKKIEKNN